MGVRFNPLILQVRQLRYLVGACPGYNLNEWKTPGCMPGLVITYCWLKRIIIFASLWPQFLHLEKEGIGRAVLSLL